MGVITGPRPGHSVRGGGRWWVEGWTPECARESFSQGPILVTGLGGLNTTGHPSPAHPPPPLPELTGLKVTARLSNNALGEGGRGLWANLFVFAQESDFSFEQPHVFAPV